MSYQDKCLFDAKKKCPLVTMKIDGQMCYACIATMLTDFQRIMAGLAKTSLIGHLLTTYGNEEKAEEIYNKIKEFARDW